MFRIQDLSYVFIISVLVQDYAFGYDVAGYDAYGNPNVHGRTEERVGQQVKGQYRVSALFFKKIWSTKRKYICLILP